MAGALGSSSSKRRRLDDPATQASREVQRCSEELAQKPGSCEILLRRGSAKSKLKDYVGAIEDFSLVLAKQPTCVAALTGRGKARNQELKLQEALKDFDRAIKVDPRNAVALQFRAELNSRLGKTEDAVSDATRVIAMQPSNSHARQIRGECLRKLRKFPEAVEDFNKALALNPRFVNALAGRGATYRACIQHAAALADYNYALSLDPKNAACLAGRGAVHLELGKNDEAEVDFRQALQVDPHNAFSFWGLKVAKKKVWKTRLRCISLAGFELDTVNVTYTEARLAEFLVNDHETYYSQNGLFVMYYCKKEGRWKVARTLDLQRIKSGRSVGILGAPQGDDLLAASHRRGWYEWDGMVWVARVAAGVHQCTFVGDVPHALVLEGFAHEAMNGRFVERREPGSLVNGRSTFVAENGQCFLYWCMKEARWKGTRMGDMPKVRAGKGLGFTGAPPGADILAKELKSGWLEWDGDKWVVQSKAGIASADPLHGR
mmetsp:Transcript_42923/g.98535  ORF Transcript_42923/g.98535 Transcript_42923/m.98535 type:complete len:490 (+) Transcript_42923:64-1533(+)